MRNSVVSSKLETGAIDGVTEKQYLHLVSGVSAAWLGVLQNILNPLGYSSSQVRLYDDIHPKPYWPIADSRCLGGNASVSQFLQWLHRCHHRGKAG